MILNPRYAVPEPVLDSPETRGGGFRTAISGFRYYNPSTGRWLSRDPLEELSFRSTYFRSLSQKDQYALNARRQTANEHNFLQNDPVGYFDALGLCPENTCDKWTITIILMRSVSTEVGAIDVRTSLEADGGCCMKEHSKYYRFLGVGMGVGLKNSVNFKIGTYRFSTPCIPWSAHEGFGRVTSVGAGLAVTYGNSIFTTPQAYFGIVSPSYGFDLSIGTYVGHWSLER